MSGWWRTCGAEVELEPPTLASAREQHAAASTHYWVLCNVHDRLWLLYHRGGCCSAGG